MKVIEVDVILPEGTSESEAAAAAEVLQDHLRTMPEFKNPEADYAGPDRGAAEVVQAIFIAAPLVIEAAKNFNTLMKAFNNIVDAFKDKQTGAPGENALRALDLSRLFVRIGDELIPVKELTTEHLERISEADA